MGDGGLRSHPDLDHDLKNFERLESLVRELVDRHATWRGERAEALVQLSRREARIDELARALDLPEGLEPFVVSGVTGEGVDELVEACWTALGGEQAGWGMKKAEN